MMGRVTLAVWVLRAGGTFHFVQHGLAPDSAVARLQQWLTLVQHRAFSGCHLQLVLTGDSSRRPAGGYMPRC
jgi:hypothetical protein